MAKKEDIIDVDPVTLKPYRFMPGQKENPANRNANRVKDFVRRIKPSSRMARQYFGLTLQEVNDWEVLLMSLSMDELKKLTTFQDIPMYVAILVKAMIEEFKRGRTDIASRLRDRQYGAVPDKVELTGANGQPLVQREISVKQAAEFIKRLEAGL